MRITMTASAVAVFLFGCTSDDHRRPNLRAALDRAEISLVDSITVATTDTPSTALQAKILLGDDEVFSVGVRSADFTRDVRVDFAGRVVSRADTSLSPRSCPDAIALVEALRVAERAVSGEAVQALPDDDVACALEIQVLVGDTLWEVKVAGDGKVLEKELSDEFGGSEDD